MANHLRHLSARAVLEAVGDFVLHVRLVLLCGERCLGSPARSGGGSVVRIHRLAHGPIHFSPGEGNPPLGRFDSYYGRFGTLYCAPDFEGAFVETILRNPGRSLVSLAEIETRGLSVISIQRDVQLVDLTGSGLSRLGLDARFLSGPYELCGTWADAFHDHPSAPSGIIYPSRFDPSQHCVALISRLAPDIAAMTAPAPLGERLTDVAAAFDRYGKARDLA